MIVQMVIEGLLDVAEDCKDRRAFWALVGSAVTLLAANISFIAMISEAFSGRVLTALVALAITGALMALTATGIVTALWIAIPADKKPRRALVWAFLSIVIIIAVPAPVLLALGILLYVFWRRKKSHR